MKKNNSLRLLFGALILLMGIGVSGCSEASRDDNGRVLIKVGNRTLTVNQYRQTFEMAVVSYPLQVLKDRHYVEGLKLMLLNQVIDELAILSRADELGLSIADGELKKVVVKIQADYPDDTFDKMLIEQSISMRKWQASLKKRLLMEKVVENDLKGVDSRIFKRIPALYESVNKVKTTGKELETEEHKKTEKLTEKGSSSPHPIESGVPTPPEKGDEMQIQSAVEPEDPYSVWITELREKYPVFIDEVLWERVIKE